jgi:hypothetical protein
MYLDSNNNEVANMISDMKSAVWRNEQLDLVTKLGAKFSKDGNQYCWLYGELPNDCVVGFGDTPAKAMANFFNNFINEKAVGIY